MTQSSTEIPYSTTIQNMPSCRLEQPGHLVQSRCPTFCAFGKPEEATPILGTPALDQVFMDTSSRSNAFMTSFFLQQTMANCYFKRSTCFFVNHFLQINLSQHQNPIQTVCTSQVAGHSECTAEGFDLSRHQKSWLHMNNLSILAGP